MKYRKYTNSSKAVSEIGLGAWQLGINSGWKNMSEKDALKMVHQALEFGVNFFDTAPNYGHGTGEERLGKALKKADRDKIVINTKFGHTHKGTMDYSARYIRESLEGSLKRMQVEYVDSLIIHNPPSEFLDGNSNDHYEILERLMEEGKIRAYGASLDTYEEMKLLMDTTNAEVIEAFFNILFQDSARAFGMAKEKGVGIIAKIPLDSGWLGGKYNAESVFEGVRSRWSRDDIRTRAELVDHIRKIIPVDAEISKVAIAFCLAYDAVSTVIPGNLNTEQLFSNIKAADQPISMDLLKQFEDFYQSKVKMLNLPW